MDTHRIINQIKDMERPKSDNPKETKLPEPNDTGTTPGFFDEPLSSILSVIFVLAMMAAIYELINAAMPRY